MQKSKAEKGKRSARWTTCISQWVKDIINEKVTFKQSHGGGEKAGGMDMGWLRESIPGQAEKCMAPEAGCAWWVRGLCGWIRVRKGEGGEWDSLLSCLPANWPNKPFRFEKYYRYLSPGHLPDPTAGCPALTWQWWPRSESYSCS